MPSIWISFYGIALPFSHKLIRISAAKAAESRLYWAQRAFDSSPGGNALCLSRNGEYLSAPKYHDEILKLLYQWCCEGLPKFQVSPRSPEIDGAPHIEESEALQLAYKMDWLACQSQTNITTVPLKSVHKILLTAALCQHGKGEDLQPSLDALVARRLVEAVPSSFTLAVWKLPNYRRIACAVSGHVVDRRHYEVGVIVDGTVPYQTIESYQSNPQMDNYCLSDKGIELAEELLNLKTKTDTQHRSAWPREFACACWFKGHHAIPQSRLSEAAKRKPPKIRTHKCHGKFLCENGKRHDLLYHKSDGVKHCGPKKKKKTRKKKR